jgi:GNAT superfamily N-acetyltransferase
MDARLPSENLESTIQYILADAEARNTPILWWITPSTRPSDLADFLKKAGFSVDEDGPGMAVILAELNENRSIPAGSSVRVVQDDEARREWCRTMASGFEIPAEKVEFAVNSWQYVISRVEAENTVAYTTYLDGRPVATSLLQLGGGVAGIYGVATIPEARRKGIGALATLYPLLQARDMGYKVGILQASDMGFPLYRSLGFQEYCRVSSYFWRPKREFQQQSRSVQQAR